MNVSLWQAVRCHIRICLVWYIDCSVFGNGVAYYTVRLIPNLELRYSNKKNFSSQFVPTAPSLRFCLILTARTYLYATLFRLLPGENCI